MVSDSANSAKKALTVAIRYAAVRRQFSAGGNNVETQLLDYPIHQRRLMPLLAQAIAGGFTALEMEKCVPPQAAVAIRSRPSALTLVVPPPLRFAGCTTSSPRPSRCSSPTTRTCRTSSPSSRRCTRRLPGSRVRPAHSTPSTSSCLRARALTLLRVLPAFCTWSCLQTIDTCRQCCGGHGYSSYSGFPAMYNDFAVQCVSQAAGLARVTSRC